MKNMTKFKLIVIDADTPLFKAAKSVEQGFIIATNKKLNISKRFDNKSQLWGHHIKKEGGWLAEYNLTSKEKSLPEDWEIEECAELHKDVTNHLDTALMSFNGFVGKIKKWNLADDYLLCLGGDGNYRYDEAQYQPYKGERKDKPLLFHELKQKIVSQYSRRVVLANGCEADDVLGHYGWSNYLNYRKTGEWKYLLAYIDKDLDMIISPSINYNEVAPNIIYKAPEDCARAFCVQLVAGDSIDNIAGLPNFTKEIQDKYSLGKTRGIGVATAIRMLRTAQTPKEMYERVVEAYKSYYGESDIHEFTNFRGEELSWTWIDFLQDNAILLWMQRTKDERINMKEVLERMGVM